MKSLTFELPAFGFVVGTRIALAFGLGLLVSTKIPRRPRRAIGLALVGLGAATTFPAARLLARGLARGNALPQASLPPTGHVSTPDQDENLIGAHRFSRKGDDNL